MDKAKVSKSKFKLAVKFLSYSILLNFLRNYILYWDYLSGFSFYTLAIVLLGFLIYKNHEILKPSENFVSISIVSYFLALTIYCSIGHFFPALYKWQSTFSNYDVYLPYYQSEDREGGISNEYIGYRFFIEKEKTLRNRTISNENVHFTNDAFFDSEFYEYQYSVKYRLALITFLIIHERKNKK